MRWMSRAVAIAAVLTPTLASATLAQRRADVSSARFSLAPRRGVMPATGNAVQQPATPPEAGPDWSIFVGVASGDNPYDIGIAAGATAKWRRSEWPVAVRAYDSSTDLGFEIGAGIKLTNKLGIELRFMDIGEFSTMPVLAVWDF